MITVIKRVLQTSIKKLIIFFSINSLFILLLASIFPSFKDEAEGLNELISNYPEGFLKAFGFEQGIEFFTDFESFIGGEHFSLVWPLLAIVFVITYGGNAIAGEIEKGTIDMLLSQPISRLKLYFSKFFAGVNLLIIFSIITIWAIYPMAYTFGVEISFTHLLTTSIAAFLFGFAILGITFYFSSFTSTNGKPTAMAAAVMIVMYALNLVATLNTDLEKLRYFSFFHYFDYNQVLINGHLPWLMVILFSIVGIVFTLLGAFCFNRRDISI